MSKTHLISLTSKHIALEKMFITLCEVIPPNNDVSHPSETIGTVMNECENEVLNNTKKGKRLSIFLIAGKCLLYDFR